MKNETYPTDAGKLRSGTPRQKRRGLWSLATLTGLILVAINGPTVWAKVSDSTSTIEGRPPTATGALSVLFPGGNTAVTNNVVMATTDIPANFRVSASTLALQDLDGDADLWSMLDTEAVTWTWQYNNVLLTPVQLAAPVSTSFLGKTLTVAASAPVTILSRTGAPLASVPKVFRSVTYTVKVPNNPVVRANDYSFAMDSGFPTTGFSQAQFQFWMDGTSAAGNSNYTFTQPFPVPWVTVDAETGVVKFISEPSTAQTVTIRITNKRAGAEPIVDYSFRVETWFKSNGTAPVSRAIADAYCTAQPGYTTARVNQMSDVFMESVTKRAVNGMMLIEWGSWARYTWPVPVDHEWVYGNYWLSGGNDAFVNYAVGFVYVDYPYISNAMTMCSKTL
ncbi:hypothetical protein B4916_23370 [Yersinia intermedia]|nr:hypothetical protein B4916_23370 [Yersinia intermedia]